ncbi:sugar ABC transporter substrate-binding protein [Halolactibacillus miurensis]|uniref:Putative aldouronate transport system substrate-binding protein n=1 Tax=Halolactibacillus miurensis TaxID=306541 RepID=A0A1I6P161_9BACI|nr:MULTISPECIES: extracellular solute-binding protein [Halolactibacillus]GEM03190.1 sugar ABC transporter substrate-binding protein [Halolactibacillus miurensis]SFS33949.1 putative aldouronate transport system substrate-binding protein [Halolactibacillus miurensis]
MKKFLLSLSMMFVLLSVLVACGDDQSDAEGNGNDANGEKVEVNKEGFPIVDEKIELSLMAPGVGIEEWENMVTLQEYEEMTNISFKFTTPPVSDFQTRLNLAFASQDLPGIILGAGTDNLTPGMEVDYGSQGVLLPLNDLIDEYAPNIKALMEEDPEIARSITTPDGNIYSLPFINNHPTAVWARGPLWYNGEWLDNLGVEELPKTVDEFYDLLVRFRDDDPNNTGEDDTIPFTDVQMNSSRAWLMAAFGMKEWGIEEHNGDVRYAPMTDNYKAYLEFMKKLYDEELLDPETFSQADEQKKAKGQENRLGLFPDWFSFFTTGRTEEEALNDPMFYPLTSEWSEERIVPGNPGMVRGTFSITKYNENPEASMRWIDYWYSQEGRDFFDKGPEGYLWEANDDGTRTPLPAPEGFESPEEYRATLTPTYGITPPMLGGLVEGEPRSDFDLFIQAETEEKITPIAETPFPLVYLTDEEQKTVNTIQQDLSSYVEQMEARFITGVEPISNWGDYVATIESMNVDEYVQIHQEAYDRWAQN